MSTIGDSITAAFTEIRSARAGDVISAEKMAWGLYVLNRLLDSWNADHRKLFTTQFVDYTLTPSLSPHTIGPSGTFNVTVRPVRVLAAQLSLGGSPELFTKIDVHEDDAWYKALAIPDLSTAIPTDVFYDPGWPLGSLYFWPVPSVAKGVRLWTSTLLTAVVQTDTFSLPPGYQAALDLTLAEELASSLGQTVAQSTATRARDARAVVFGNNDEIPNAVMDGGVPSTTRSGGYNYLTGFNE